VAVAESRYDFLGEIFICKILYYGISHRSVHPLNQQRQQVPKKVSLSLSIVQRTILKLREIFTMGGTLLDWPHGPCLSVNLSAYDYLVQTLPPNPPVLRVALSWPAESICNSISPELSIRPLGTSDHSPTTRLP